MSFRVAILRSGGVEVTIRSENDKKASIRLDSSYQVLSAGMSLVTAALQCRAKDESGKISTGEYIDSFANEVMEEILSDSCLYSDVKEALRFKKCDNDMDSECDSDSW